MKSKTVAPKGNALSKNFWKAESPAKWEYFVAAVLAVLCFFLFAHPDILETANHTWLFMDNVSSGNFFGFYDAVLAHQNALSYANAAHYNVFVYAVFSVWMFPIYMVCQIISAAAPEVLIAFWAKLLTCLLAVRCGVLIQQLAMRLGSEEGAAKRARLSFILSPVVLVTVFSMGQYDTLCLLLVLMGINYYFQKRTLDFAIVMGAALACKFFAFLIFVPLLLLIEKRLLHIAKYLLISLWVYIPTSLMFMGRTGDMHIFNDIMIKRVFEARLPGGISATPLYLCGLGLLMVYCYCTHEVEDAARNKKAIWVSLASLSGLFLCVSWHPQWLVLLVPFSILAGCSLQRKTLWTYLEIAFYSGFLILTYLNFKGQIEANMTDAGLIGLLGGMLTSEVNFRTLSFYFNLIPYIAPIAATLFAVPLLCGMFLKIPFRGGVTADLLSRGAPQENFYPRAAMWAVSAVGIFGFLLVCVFEWLKCFGFL